MYLLRHFFPECISLSSVLPHGCLSGTNSSIIYTHIDSVHEYKRRRSSLFLLCLATGSLHWWCPFSSSWGCRPVWSSIFPRGGLLLFFSSSENASMHESWYRGSSGYILCVVLRKRGRNRGYNLLLLAAHGRLDIHRRGGGARRDRDDSKVFQSPPLPPRKTSSFFCTHRKKTRKRPCRPEKGTFFLHKRPFFYLSRSPVAPVAADSPEIDR